ncbi:MAG: protein-export membrane protein SecD [Candidatus Yanofskybacteria bacterium RIFCSPHIGHO2_02_FULL_43_15c]|uniref:Protein translocase subunit SecD n=1 Tax=Candidatus Yanofskybacteria bacterium RIFCSPHIGHO2_02_FULL_43_15c TaxID=1802679 RepID=A0A1F8FL50_9BACT|nr:MAG: protein-export membrane protein SecD [Candidatus Yanofskybacteria bacterium RIFCSPHIGHO2_02_FULL_43_15c]
MAYAKKSLIILGAGIFLFLLVYPFSFLPGWLNPPFRLGLDLLGGTHLVYQADLSNLAAGQNSTDAMEGVRDVIERRVNAFGVAEPLVQVQGKDRLVVELAGVKDISRAIHLIGETPFLQFKEERPEKERDAILEAQKNQKRLNEDPYFIETALTGKYLTRAQVTFSGGVQNIGAQVALEFNSEGAEVFKQLTEKNLGKRLAIYLDGHPISAPVVQAVIADGSAVISGNFTTKEAKELAIRLNSGALPVPIGLISQQSVGASLGQDSLTKSLKAGVIGLMLVGLYMILFYRLPGLAAVLALGVYTLIVLAIYKLIPVTLTLAGMAGFILSLGMAVDANVLIFARMREELKAGKNLNGAFQEGFRRAWLSIRDSHVTTLLGALALYLFTTSIVKGFALTLGVGVLISLFSAITVTRSFLGAVIGPRLENRKWLF